MSGHTEPQELIIDEFPDIDSKARQHYLNQPERKLSANIRDNTNRIDRYGFIKGTQEYFSPVNTKQTEKEIRSSFKWVRMMQKLETKEPKFIFRSHRLRKRIFKGIPDDMRVKAWEFLFCLNKIQPDNELNDLFKIYSNYEEQIDLDIQRTLRNHELFSQDNSPSQSSLFRILVAYSNLNLDVGYCQGMSVIVAFLLIYFEENTAFKILVSIMNEDYLYDLFTPGFPKLHETFSICATMAKRRLHRVMSHLTKVQIPIDSFATKWFITLYVCFEMEFTVRVWDLFSYFGFDIFIIVFLSLLDYLKKDILSGDFEADMGLLTQANLMQFNVNYIIYLVRAYVDDGLIFDVIDKIRNKYRHNLTK